MWPLLVYLCIMLKKLSYQGLSMLMAILVVTSSTSFALEQHFCKGHLVDYSFFQKVVSCGMEMEEPTKGVNPEIGKTGCCKNENLIVEGQDELQITFENLSVDQQFVIVRHAAVSSMFTYASVLPPLVIESPPPDLERDFQILFQTFII